MSITDIDPIEADMICAITAMSRYASRHDKADLEIDEIETLYQETASFQKWLDRKRGERMAKIEQAVRASGAIK